MSARTYTVLAIARRHPKLYAALRAPKSGAWTPITGSAAQWWQWRNVPWRSDAPARRRDEPRASRFGGLTA